MRRHFAIAALVALVAFVSSRNSFAAGEAENSRSNGFADRLFAQKLGKQDKSYACFVSRYDAAHLARHPLQKVSTMKLLVTAETVPEDESLNYSFRLGVRFRHRPGEFDSSGDCGHTKLSEVADDKAELECAVDCDGGGITVALTGNDKSTRVRLDRIRIWRNNHPDDDDFSLSGGADDRVFRLDRTKLEDCRALVSDRKELAAMRHK